MPFPRYRNGKDTKTQRKGAGIYTSENVGDGAKRNRFADEWWVTPRSHSVIDGSEKFDIIFIISRAYGRYVVHGVSEQ